MFTFSNFQLIPNYQKLWLFENQFFLLFQTTCFSRALPLSLYHSRATRTWSVCNKMCHNAFRYEYLTFQTHIHLHKQYIFDTNIIQSEYAFLFPFSIY